MGAVRLLLFLKTTPLEKLYELERVHLPGLHDNFDLRSSNRVGVVS